MYLFNLDSNNFEKMIENNNIILIGVYEKDCIISDLFKGVIQKINNFVSKKIIVAIIEKDEFVKISPLNEKQIFPISLVYEKGQIVKKMYGFYNYFTLIKEIKKTKLNI